MRTRPCGAAGHLPSPGSCSDPAGDADRIEDQLLSHTPPRTGRLRHAHQRCTSRMHLRGPTPTNQPRVLGPPRVAPAPMMERSAHRLPPGGAHTTHPVSRPGRTSPECSDSRATRPRARTPREVPGSPSQYSGLGTQLQRVPHPGPPAAAARPVHTGTEMPRRRRQPRRNTSRTLNLWKKSPNFMADSRFS